MEGYIGKFNAVECEAMRYWSFAKSYKGDKWKEIKAAAISGNYVASRKRDGVYERFVKDDDGNLFMLSRDRGVNGHFANKIDWVPQFYTFLNELPNGTCFTAEVCLMNNEEARQTITILGCLKDKALERQKITPLCMYIFDIYCYNGQDFRKSPITDRIKVMDTYFKPLVENNTYVHYSEYYTGDAILEQLNDILESGGEGMVLTHKNAQIYDKRTPARITIKVKKEIRDTVDVFLTGKYEEPTKLYTGKSISTWAYWIDKDDNRIHQPKNTTDLTPVTKNYFYNFAGSIEIAVYDEKKDIVIPLGLVSGIPDTLKEEIVVNNENCIHRVFEFNGMDFNTDTMRFRHGKIVRERTDKKWNECSIAQVEAL
jgi:hypothetical protein